MLSAYTVSYPRSSKKADICSCQGARVLCPLSTIRYFEAVQQVDADP